MNKVCSIELKKALSKPGIFILAVFLTLILVLGVFVYNPSSHYPSEINFNGTNIQSVYSNFKGDDDSFKTYGYKVMADQEIEKAISLVNSYNVDSQTMSEKFSTLKLEFDNALISYTQCQTLNSDTITSQRKAHLVTSIENLNTFIQTGITNSSKGCYSLLISKKNYIKYCSSYESVITWANVNVSSKNIYSHIDDYNNNYKKSFEDSIYSIKYISLSNSLITELSQTDYNIVQTNLSQILIEINKTKSDNDSTKLEELKNLANKYVYTATTFANYVKYKLISHAFNALTSTESMNMLYLSDYNKADSNTLVKRYEYLFRNNKTERDFAYPLTIGTNSTEISNMYDYTYFVLRLFSFIIVVYVIYQASHTIAGEIKDGTMRYMAIRPITRNELLFGKMLSIFVLTSILIIFSAVISLIVGFFIYGGSSKLILTIFNGSEIAIMKPINMILIYVISLLIEVAVYMCLTILLSVILKSDLMNLCLIALLYLINNLMPMFTIGANSWLSFYPFSYISLYALFGSSIYAPSGNFFNLVLGAKVYAGTSLMLFAIIVTTIIVVSSIIASKKFKKKEL